MDYPHPDQSPGEAGTCRILGQVDFDHVTFSYDPEKVISGDVTFDVKPGQTHRFGGPTGEASPPWSTWSSPLLRHGQRRCASTATTCPESACTPCGSRWASCPGQLHLLGTIMDNIRYGRLDATDEEVIAAAKAVHAHEFV